MARVGPTLSTVLLGGASLLLLGAPALAQDNARSVPLSVLATLFAVFGIVGFPMAAWLILTAKVDIDKGRGSTAWPTVPGRIVESSVQEETEIARSLVDLFSNRDSVERQPSYRPFVRYEYAVNGTTHVGNVVRIGLESMHEATAGKVVARYPLGSEVTVHYDPNDPATATLETGVEAAVSRHRRGIAAAIAPFVFTLLFWLLIRYAP